MNNTVVNGNVACLPIDRNIYKPEANKLSILAPRGKLIELSVLYGTNSGVYIHAPAITLEKGDKIYVRADCLNKAWSKEVLSFYNNDTIQFILVPITEIVFVDRNVKSE
jgi:hypothetical protein